MINTQKELVKSIGEEGSNEALRQINQDLNAVLLMFGVSLDSLSTWNYETGKLVDTIRLYLKTRKSREKA